MGDRQDAHGVIGIVFVLAICWGLSEDRRRFPWRQALAVLAIQAGLVLLLFGAPQAQGALAGVDFAVAALADASQTGAQFVFGFLAGGPAPYVASDATPLYILAFRVLPVILVICAASALLWRWHVLRWLTAGFGLVFERTLGLRGPAALATAATIFMGQVEGAIFIKGYLGKLARADLFLLLAVGMSCVSGSTMVAYATILQASLPNAAAHVLAASIISAPAGVLLARILVPADTRQAGDMAPVAEAALYDSTIDALVKGTHDGLSVVLNVAASLVVVVALIALGDRLLGLAPPVAGAPVSIERTLGFVLAPLAWMIGVPAREAGVCGRLLGVKLVLTEFSGFVALGRLSAAQISDHTRMVMTYALCGFANLVSVGINVAGFGVLAPERRAEVQTLIWRALLAGFLATCMTAAVVGLLPEALFFRR